jgi:uncharacterized membrane protein (DUF485 family)
MAEVTAPRAVREHAPEIDWDGAERSPEFKRLVSGRRRFIIPATIFFMVLYFGFIALAGWAPGFMSESISGGFTVGWALGLSLFPMTWGLAWLYLRKSDRDFDPLAERAAERAVEGRRETFVDHEEPLAERAVEGRRETVVDR